MDLEFASPQERLYDFCLWEYQPLANPAGKLRSINLLHNSFTEQGMAALAWEMVAAIRRGLGDLRTVWGIKQEEGRINWELYFYDYERQDRTRSIPLLLEIVKPWLSCYQPAVENLPYFMFSLDFDRSHLEQGKTVDEMNVYIGNPGSLVSSGICYGMTAKAARLKNFYFFFDARTQMEEIVDKACTSVHVDVPGFHIDQVLWPEMRNCQTLVVANKQDRDAVYFSRVRVEQLLIFLERLAYPKAQIEFVATNLDRLSHMLYDVGFDYRVEDGRLKIVKSAYYGVF